PAASPTPVAAAPVPCAPELTKAPLVGPAITVRAPRGELKKTGPPGGQAQSMPTWQTVQVNSTPPTPTRHPQVDDRRSLAPSNAGMFLFSASAVLTTCRVRCCWLAVQLWVLRTLFGRTTASSCVSGWRLMMVILPGILARVLTERPAASERWFSTASMEASWK